MKIIQSEYLPDGKWALIRDGHVVCIVNRGDLIGDAEFDAIMMPRIDFEALRSAIPRA